MADLRLIPGESISGCKKVDRHIRLIVGGVLGALCDLKLCLRVHFHVRVPVQNNVFLGLMLWRVGVDRIILKKGIGSICCTACKYIPSVEVLSSS